MAHIQKNQLSKIDSFESLFAEAEKHPEYWVEGAILEFTDEVLRAIRDAGLSRSDFAEKLGQSRPQVSRLLSGRNNFTLRTMVEVSRALDCRLRLHLQPDGMHSKWVDYNLSGRSTRLVTTVSTTLSLKDTFQTVSAIASANVAVTTTAGTYEALPSAA